jgi:hypothetical protein
MAINFDWLNTNSIENPDLIIGICILFVVIIGLWAFWGIFKRRGRYAR